MFLANRFLLLASGQMFNLILCLPFSTCSFELHMKIGMIFVNPLRVRSLPLFIAKDKSNVNFNALSSAVI